MTTGQHTLDVFLPELLRRGFERAPADEAAHERRAQGAMIFVDVAGFGLATDRFSREGADGIERLTALLNATFGRSIAVTVAHGGDVVSFAGDAFNALWLSEVGVETDARAALVEAIVRAAQCALAVQASFAQHRGELDFAVKIAVTCGELSFVEVGDGGERRLYFAAGEVQAQLAETLARGRAGEVWISGAARAAAGSRLGIRSSIPGCAKLYRVREPLPPSSSGHEGDRLLPSPASDARGRRYVPPAALAWFDSGLSRWSAELRTATVAFIALPMPRAGEAESLAAFQAVVAELIAATDHFEGGINKLSVDEKGLALISAWGLPPHSHEDDAARGVLCMLAYAEALRCAGAPVKIGVATGTVYSGLIGSELRREYTMMGQAMNVAARLAQQADDGVLCDLATYKSAALNVEFEARGLLQLKHVAAAIETFEPKGMRVERISRSDIEIVGRSEERDTIMQWMLRYLVQREGGVLLIEGEPGIGKSRLLDFIRVRASKRKIKTISGEADAINRNAPYFAWRAILIEALGLKMPADLDELPSLLSDEVYELLRGQEPYVSLAPLLGDILPIELPETKFTRSLQHEARANNLSRLVARLLKNAAERDPLIVVIDDTHWFDSASWALLLALVRTVRRIAFVISHRPMSEPQPLEWKALRDHPDNLSVALGSLSDHSIGALLHRCLDVDTIAPEIAELIISKAEGNPLYTEQLALSLRDAGAIVVRGRSCGLNPELGAGEGLGAFNIPATVQGVVLSRLNRLPARAQLFVKIASVLGRTFDARLIGRLYAEISAEQVEAIADALVEQHVFNRASARSMVLEFRHMIMRDAVYTAMLKTQRVDLHRGVLGAYEAEGASDEQLPALVHHALQAEAWTRSLDYLERAGRLSLSRWANRECITYFERALELVASQVQLDAPPSVAQLGEWRWHLAEAHFRLGEVDACMTHGLGAVADLGIPLPRRPLGRLRRMLRLIAERNFPGLRRSFAPSEDAGLAERRAQVLTIQARLTDSFGFQMDPIGMVLSSLRELALAEVLGRPGLAASAQMMLYFITAVTPLRKIAAPWPERALELIEREPEPDVRARVLSRVGLAKLQADAQFERARVLMDEALGIASSLGDMRLLAEVEAGSAFVALCMGELGRAAGAYRSMSRATRYSGDAQMGTWAKVGRAHIDLIKGEAPLALRSAQAFRASVEATKAVATYAWGMGVLGLAALECGDYELAREAGSSALRRVAKEPVLGAYWAWGGLESLCELFLGLDDPRRAKQAVKQLGRFAEALPFAEPSLLYYRGRLARARGRDAEAIAQLEACVALTQRIRLPRTKLLAHRQLVQLHGTNSVEGAAHRRRAEALSSSLAASSRILESVNTGPFSAASQSMSREAANTG